MYANETNDCIEMDMIDSVQSPTDVSAPQYQDIEKITVKLEIEPIVENTNTLETLSPAEEVFVTPAMADVLSNNNSALKQSSKRKQSTIAIEIYTSEPKIILTDINDTYAEIIQTIDSEKNENPNRKIPMSSPSEVEIEEVSSSKHNERKLPKTTNHLFKNRSFDYVR